MCDRPTTGRTIKQKNEGCDRKYNEMALDTSPEEITCNCNHLRHSPRQVATAVANAFGHAAQFQILHEKEIVSTGCTTEISKQKNFKNPRKKSPDLKNYFV